MPTKKKQPKLFKHLKSIGFTNRLSLYCLFFIFCTLIAGFSLAILSLRTGYIGSLICFTATITPVSTATSIALTASVQKSKAENTSGGIKYEMALANILNDTETETVSDDNQPTI